MPAKKKTKSLQNASEAELLISVVIPVYNVENYLPEAIESVLSQELERMEVIAINDGSNDSSGDLLDVYAKKDSRLKVIHQKNRGLSAVRNRGLKLARGKYIYFFDSDDVLLQGSLNKVINRLEDTGSHIARFSVSMMDEVGNLRRPVNKKAVPGLEVSAPINGEVFLQSLFQSGNYGAIVQKFTFLKSFLLHNNLLFDEGYIHEDEAFTMESLCLADKVVSFNEVMLLKRMRSGSIMSAIRNEENIKGWLRAAKRLLQFIDDRTLSQEMENVIKTKVSQLILISLNNIRQINRRADLNLDLFDYITRKDLQKTGFIFSLKVRYNFLYRTFYKLKSFFS